MICGICEKDYQGHFNSRYCSLDCKRKAKNKVNKKYNSKIKKIKEVKINNNVLENEIWKPVPIKDFEELYQISNLGRVKGKIRKGGGGFLKKILCKNGYYSVGLRNKNKDNKIHRFLIHRLIALAFIENPNNYPIIDHINRIRTDNRIENLRWVTFEINSQNKFVEGSICLAKDKRKLKNGEIKIYNYYRIKYRNGFTKRFKNKNDALFFLENLRNNDKINNVK